MLYCSTWIDSRGVQERNLGQGQLRNYPINRKTPRIMISRCSSAKHRMRTYANRKQSYVSYTRMCFHNVASLEAALEENPGSGSLSRTHNSSTRFRRHCRRHCRRRPEHKSISNHTARSPNVPLHERRCLSVWSHNDARSRVLDKPQAFPLQAVWTVQYTLRRCSPMFYVM